MSCTRAVRRVLAVAAVPVLAACGDAAGPDPGMIDVELSFEGLRALDPEREGSYEAWAVGGEGEMVSAGRFDAPPEKPFTLGAVPADPEHIVITVEPPGDDDESPSEQELLGGPVRDGGAALDAEDYVTAGVPFEESPGTHVLFTPSDNGELGYPSNEDAGIWLFNITGDTLDGSFHLTFTLLSRGWIYEGWMVHDYGTDDAVWVSYGKFEPDHFRRASSRDRTGAGPFSGQIDYEHALPEEVIMPGDDWVANPFGHPVPGGLELPFDLNGCLASAAECEEAGQAPGPSRWTHVITVEPAWDEGEPHVGPDGPRPFLLQPYRNPIGEGTPATPRTIEFHPELLPRGTAVIRPSDGGAEGG